MCRLLGITSFDFAEHQQLVEAFCGLAQTGMVLPGDEPGHKDGWGLAFYRENGLTVLKSGLSILDEKDRVLDTLKQAGTSPVMILHLRKSAWTNTTSTRHAHPFDHRNICFVHNGTVYDYQGLLADVPVPGRPQPDALDTEVLFHHILSGGSDELEASFRRSISTIKQKHTFSALNSILSDGKTMYVYRDYSKAPDYYSLFAAQAESSAIASSQPLSDRLSWRLMTQGELAVFSVV